MPTQLKPIIHGRDHSPDGADPIPGFGPGFADKIAAIAAAHPNRLLGYWRLGEPASPFADTSGHSGGAADAAKVTTGTVMSIDIPGGLAAAQDDGAVEFNNSTGGAGDYLTAPNPASRFNLSNKDMTICAWLKVKATASSIDTVAVGDFNPASGGWYLGVMYPAQQPRLHRGGAGTSGFILGPAITAGTWVFVVGTYSLTAGYKLYYNGAEVAANTDPAPASISNLGNGPAFGRNRTGGPGFQSYYGGLDEVSVWDIALTADEVLDLSDAGQASGGAQGPPGPAGPQGPAGEGVPVGGTAGQVLTKDTPTDYDTSWQTAAGGGHAIQDEGIALAARAALNFVGAGVTAADDAANNRTNVTVPGPTFARLADLTLAAPGFFSFAGLSQAYAHLLMLLFLRGTDAGTFDPLAIRLNGDVGPNYYWGRTGANDATSASEFGTSSLIRGPSMPAAGAAANNFGAAFVLIPNYTDAGAMQPIVTGGFAAVGTSVTRFGGGLWVVGTAINNVQVFDEIATNWAAGSRATIYGLG
jgi:Concanavalin A-like lectin/glucanases superfamily